MSVCYFMFFVDDFSDTRPPKRTHNLSMQACAMFANKLLFILYK